jgi:flagellar L-ring protein FlgH
LFGDRRATGRGDILTVVIEIDDKAEISNSTGRKRSGSEEMSIPSLLGIPQRINEKLPEGATMAEAVSTSGASTFSGEGSVARKEKLTLRVAATVVEELPNGVLRIEGQQEVRVNFEMRELVVTGYVRPTDISRQNEITYDKIAGARIAYGGRGQITDFQQPRYGQQAMRCAAGPVPTPCQPPFARWRGMVHPRHLPLTDAARDFACRPQPDRCRRNPQQRP